MNYPEIACRARLKVLDMIYKAQTSHIGSNLSVIDILTVLYMGVAKNLDGDLRPDRDRIILSKGWAAASLYYFLAEKGIIPKGDLETYCMPGSKYIGLAEPTVRGVEAAGGAMGHGLPMGVGMALAAKRAGESWHTYVVMSDGEMQCGTTWECALLAAHHQLDNLTVIVDCNGWQAMGRIQDVLDTTVLSGKWEGFGWCVFVNINGHHYETLLECLESGWQNGPNVTLARTIKGKGVPEMEDKLGWHYWNIPEDVYLRAKEALCKK